MRQDTKDRCASLFFAILFVACIGGAAISVYIGLHGAEWTRQPSVDPSDNPAAAIDRVAHFTNGIQVELHETNQHLVELTDVLRVLPSPAPEPTQVLPSPSEPPPLQPLPHVSDTTKPAPCGCGGK